MNRSSAVASLLALALAGCATTDPGLSGGRPAVAVDGGYYVAADESQGDYYYGRPEVEYYADDPWYGSSFGPYGFGFSSWGFGYGPWFGPPPWWWGWHHHGWHHHWDHGPVIVHGPTGRPAGGSTAPTPSPRPHAAPIRAPRHGFQH